MASLRDRNVPAKRPCSTTGMDGEAPRGPHADTQSGRPSGGKGLDTEAHSRSRPCRSVGHRGPWCPGALMVITGLMLRPWLPPWPPAGPAPCSSLHSVGFHGSRPFRQAERKVNMETAWWFAGAHLLSGLAGPLEDPSWSASKWKAIADPAQENRRRPCPLSAVYCEIFSGSCAQVFPPSAVL
jgi:hypothetical protein